MCPVIPPSLARSGTALRVGLTGRLGERKGLASPLERPKCRATPVLFSCLMKGDQSMIREAFMPCQLPFLNEVCLLAADDAYVYD